MKSGIRAEATERRSQQDNLRIAVQRLQVNLAIQIRSKIACDSPSDFWKKRFPGGMLKINPSHADFGAVISELLDACAHFEWDQKRVAAWLGSSPSQVIKLLKSEPRALLLVNQTREELGMPRLH